MSRIPDTPRLYLYMQSYQLASQDQQSQPTIWHEYFYASDDGEARKQAENILALKNTHHLLPYIETALERSTQDAHVDYYLLPAIKERRQDGTYRACYQQKEQSQQ